MTKKSHQITSNLAGRLNKIRSGVVYSSITSVISELLQNCQRAKAENIFCDFTSGTLTIVDDGIGCKDPDDVFTLDKSVWESTSEGFGEGFTAVYTVADYLEVYSRNWLVRMDIDKMIATGDLAYQPEEAAEYLKGFKIKITGTTLKENETQLESFLRYSAALLPMPVYINGEKIPKANLANIPSETGLIKTFENKLYTAHLTPSPYIDEITTFYENRQVSKESAKGATGNIVLKKNAVTLKAPDRRAIIDDPKYIAFKVQAEKDIKKLYKDFVKEATNELIDRYAAAIAEILEVKDYENLLSLTIDMFNMYVSDDENEPESEDAPNKPPKILKPQLDIFYEDTTRGEDNADFSYDFSHYYDDAPSMEQVKTLAPRAKDNNLLSIVKSDKLFWVESKYLQSYKEAITNLEYYGFKGIIASNKVYEKLFDHYKVPHVSHLIRNIKKDYTYTNVGAKTFKERRALFLLARIEAHYNLPETFNIANLSMKIVGSIDGRELKTPQNVIEGVCQGKKIYLDRKSLKLADFTIKTWNTNHIGVEDIRFILRNSSTISHELAHLLYNTDDNTLAHMQAQAHIAKEIGYLF